MTEAVATIEARLKAEARRLGFDLVGIAPATEADDFGRLQEWLSRGYAGEMHYMSRHAAARRHPESIMLDVRSVVMVGVSYHAADGEAGSATEAPRARGRVARYARGEDYHFVLRRKLKKLLGWLQAELPQCHGRAVVDTAPLLERDFARRAGLGWIGKNTMLIDKRRGSYILLGALLVNVALRPDNRHPHSHCGTCTACLDACPTAAFVGPGLLDSPRCISYLTIELRSQIDEQLRPGLGDWVFGCDICQEVCPWNRKALPGTASDMERRGDLAALDLFEVLGLTEEAFRRRFQGTALLRSRRCGLVRNAAIALANLGDPVALTALERVKDDPDPIVREAVRWAIGRLNGGASSPKPKLGCDDYVNSGGPVGGDSPAVVEIG